jgi:hypothetical protein
MGEAAGLLAQFRRAVRFSQVLGMVSCRVWLVRQVSQPQEGYVQSPHAAWWIMLFWSLASDSLLLPSFWSVVFRVFDGGV